MTFKFSARVGEIIKGNLARGEGGRFISADELQAKQDAIKARILRLIRAGIIPPTAGDPEQVAAAQGDIDFTSFVEGKIEQVGTLKPKKKRKRQSAKQAKKSSSKKSSKRSEKRKAEKAENEISKEDEQKQNIADVQSTVNLPELSDLIAYRDGEAVDSDKLNNLVSKGLLEVAPDGTIRMNPSGSKLVRAAKRGDTRAAQDAISEGSERVTKAQERIDDKQELSSRYTERIAELDSDIVEAETAIQENANQISEAQNELAGNEAEQNQAQVDLQSRLQTIASDLANGALDQASAAKLTQQAKQETTKQVEGLQKQSETIRNRVNRLNERDTRLKSSLQFKRDLQDRFRDRRETVNEDIADLRQRYQIDDNGLPEVEKIFAETARLSNKTKEADEVFSKYHQTVNMSASELERWSNTDCSKKASLDRSPITRNLRLLRKKKADWTANDIKDANRTISFVSRMRGAEQGKPVSEGCPSKRDISLKNWAYNPSKTKEFSFFKWIYKNITSYRQQLRRLVTQYHSEQITEQEFIDEFIDLLAREFENAWLSESPFNSIDQLPPDQRSELFDQINQQIPFIENFAGDIDPAKPLDPYLSRVVLWTRRFDEIAIRARIMADPDSHYEWILGATDIHCESCSALSRIVKTGQYWLDKQVLPQVANATYLICQGYNCKCELRKTNKPVTEGPLPVVIP